jgi:hypothetical protein
MKEGVVFDPSRVRRLASVLRNDAGFWRLKGQLQVTSSSSIDCNITQSEVYIEANDIAVQSRLECLAGSENSLYRLKELIEKEIF